MKRNAEFEVFPSPREVNRFISSSWEEQGVSVF